MTTDATNPAPPDPAALDVDGMRRDAARSLDVRTRVVSEDVVVAHARACLTLLDALAARDAARASASSALKREANGSGCGNW